MGFYSNVFWAVANYIAMLWEGLLDIIFEATLPVTQYIFSKRPLSPGLQIRGARSNTAELRILPKPASRYNVDTYEIQMATLDCNSENDWKTCYTDIGCHPGIHGLKPQTGYQLRVRARNFWGQSSWSPEIQLSTLSLPINGGGAGPGYTWQQTTTEVIVDFPLHAYENVRPKQVAISLRPDTMTVKLQTSEGLHTLLHTGTLSAKVKLLGDGSFWELTTEADGTLHLLITLEKADATAGSALFGDKHPTLWDCVVNGHPRVDVTNI